MSYVILDNTNTAIIHATCDWMPVPNCRAAAQDDLFFLGIQPGTKCSVTQYSLGDNDEFTVIARRTYGKGSLRLVLTDAGVYNLAHRNRVNGHSFAPLGLTFENWEDAQDAYFAAQTAVRNAAARQLGTAETRAAIRAAIAERASLAAASI